MTYSHLHSAHVYSTLIVQTFHVRYITPKTYTTVETTFIFTETN